MIYVSRIVTVSKGLSLIDEQIVLYKGDKNVEVQFTLKNNPFKEKNGTTSTYATFGQLIINRDAGPIISEVSQISNNRVVFIITGEMIDEFEEVGNYSFQIRLFNEDQSSRATLPPVKDGIAINEPICEEAAASRSYVNSRRSVVANDNGIMMLALDESDGLFDEDGNYNRTNWVGGDIITDTRLNRVENAIYQINDSVLTDYTTQGYVDDRINSNNSYIIGCMDGKYTTEDYVDRAIANLDYVDQNSALDMISSNNNYILSYTDDRYVTEEYVDRAIENIEAPEVDLTGYATEAYVNNVLGDIEDLLGGI